MIGEASAAHQFDECRTLVLEAIEHAEDNQLWRDLERFHAIGEAVDAMWVWSRRLIEAELPEQ